MSKPNVLRQDMLPQYICITLLGLSAFLSLALPENQGLTVFWEDHC